MADLFVPIRIMPESIDINLDHLMHEIKQVLLKHGKLLRENRTPIAFGLMSIDVTIVMAQKAGGTDPVENDLKKIKGVGDVQVQDVSLVPDVKGV